MVSITTMDTPTTIALALRYPTEDAMTKLEASVDALPKGGAEKEMRKFIGSIEKMDLSRVEEVYTATFDLTPVVAPYVGHLVWADSYERGTFMAELKGAMRDVGVDPEGELPDHLEPILRYLAVAEEPIDRLDPVLVPAITKMEKTLKKSDSKNPYVHVLAAARIYVEERMR